MAKSQDTKKEAKKKPSKSLKEKRAAKKEKKKQISKKRTHYPKDDGFFEGAILSQ